VQPARAPKPTERPAAAGDGSGRSRVPYFATFSVQRAMPPAPSLKKPDSRPLDSAQSPQAPAPESPRVDVPAGEAVIEPPAHSATAGAGSEAQGLDAEAAAWPPAEMLLADSDTDTTEPAAAEDSIEPAASDEAPSDEAPSDEALSDEVRPDQANEVDDPRAAALGRPEIEPAVPAEAAEDIENRRAKARDMRARWIAAHDLDSPHLGEPVASRATETRDEVPERREPTFEMRTEKSDSAETAKAGPKGPAGEAVTAEPPKVSAAMPIEALDEIAGRKEPTFDRP